MSINEFIASLGPQVGGAPTAFTLSNLEAFVTAFNGFISKLGFGVTSPPYLNKVVLRGDGSNIYADFEPHLEVFATIASNKPVISLGCNGKGTSTQKGSGEFVGKYTLPVALSGTYKLHVGTTTAKLFEGDEQIWSASGTHEGLEGIYDLQF